MKKTTDEKIMFLLDSARGVYIPQNFIQDFDLKAWHVNSKEVINDLQNPENEGYWDAWITLLDTAYFIDEDNVTWRLLQDGDLWAISDELTEGEWEERFPN